MAERLVYFEPNATNALKRFVEMLFGMDHTAYSIGCYSDMFLNPWKIDFLARRYLTQWVVDSYTTFFGVPVAYFTDEQFNDAWDGKAYKEKRLQAFRDAKAAEKQATLTTAASQLVPVLSAACARAEYRRMVAAASLQRALRAARARAELERLKIAAAARAAEEAAAAARAAEEARRQENIRKSEEAEKFVQCPVCLNDFMRGSSKLTFLSCNTHKMCTWCYPDYMKRCGTKCPYKCNI